MDVSYLCSNSLLSFVTLTLSLPLTSLPLLRIETVADQVPEAIIKSAMRLAHESVQRIIAGQVSNVIKIMYYTVTIPPPLRSF